MIEIITDHKPIAATWRTRLSYRLATWALSITALRLGVWLDRLNERLFKVVVSNASDVPAFEKWLNEHFARRIGDRLDDEPAPKIVLPTHPTVN